MNKTRVNIIKYKFKCRLTAKLFTNWALNFALYAAVAYCNNVYNYNYVSLIIN